MDFLAHLDQLLFAPVTTQKSGKTLDFRLRKPFQRWLDHWQVPYKYLDKSKFYVSEHLQGRLKRPDFEPGIAGIGQVAIDVKTKTI